MESGEQLKQGGIALTLSNETEDWKKRVISVVSSFPTDFEFTVDTLQCRSGIGEPHHSSAWGGIVHTLAAQRMIEATGKYVKSTRPTRHAAVVQIWRKRSGPVAG